MKCPQKSDNTGNENCWSSQKGLLSVKSRRQALSLCLDAMIVVVVQILNPFLLKMFHGFKFLCIVCPVFLWHITPLVYSIPYCLTNGVLFNDRRVVK